MSVQVPKLFMSKIKAVSTTPLRLTLTPLRFSKIVVLDKCMPIPMLPESRMIRWHFERPEMIIKKLMEHKFKAQSMLEQIGSYYALELQSMQHELVDRKAELSEMCSEHAKQKSQMADLEVLLESVKMSESAWKSKHDEYVNIIRAMQGDGIDIGRYTLPSKQGSSKGKGMLEASTRQDGAESVLKKDPRPCGTGLNASAFSFAPNALSAAPEATHTSNQATSSNGAGLGASK
jgi:hypothetical protein